MDPLVSINIVTYNAHVFIKKALASTLGQTYKHIEVNVLDNKSSDDTVKIVRSLRHERLHLYKSKENTGFAKGHNILIKKSRGAFVLLLNQDAWLEEHMVATALEIFEKHDKIAAIQPKIFRYDFLHERVVEKKGKPVIDATGLVMLKNRRIIARGQGQMDTGQFDNQEEIFGADGAVPIYRRSALEDIKVPRQNDREYFDEDFFMYKEDVDLAWRLRLYGWKALYSPDLLAYHARGSGESASRNFLDIIKEREHISILAKSLSWRNQRLMQVKNELPGPFLRDGVVILLKEIVSFLYILIYERYALRSMKEFLLLLPLALEKRQFIMAHRKVSNADMYKWFE